VSVVVVLPTYNERENIERVARAILARPAQPRLLVVDDGSPDGTGGIVTALGQEFPGRVTLLARSGKSGLGKAYAAGFEAAVAGGDADVVVQMDADGSHDPADIDRLIAALDDADVALGSRYVAGGSVSGWSRHRELISRGGNRYARLLLGTDLRDLTGGFKAWRADCLAGLDAASTASDGYAFQIEMTVRALRAGARIVEIPIVFHERVAGSSKMSTRIAIEALLGVPAMRKRTKS
jgi:dolichol-phosphate mannosyltransferase